MKFGITVELTRVKINVIFIRFFEGVGYGLSWFQNV